MRRILLLIVGPLLVGACALAPTLAPTLVPLLPATATQGPLPNVDWLSYHDDVGGFTIQHPLTWQQVDTGDGSIQFALSAAPGSTLLEKLLQIDVTPNATACSEMRYDGGTTSTSNVTINGVDFLKETGAGLGAGNVYEWTGYSTRKGTTCITVTFVLHSANPGVYETPPPDFDEAAESQIFDQMINTFRFDN